MNFKVGDKVIYTSSLLWELPVIVQIVGSIDPANNTLRLGSDKTVLIDHDFAAAGFKNLDEFSDLEIILYEIKV